METGKAINRLSNRLRRRSETIQASIGLSGALGGILNYILVESEQRHVYQVDVEKEFGLRPSTATEALRKLEIKGLIERITDPQDARRKQIVFTQKAQDIEELLRWEITQSEELLLQNISEEEKAVFLDIAERMLENLDEQSS